MIASQQPSFATPYLDLSSIATRTDLRRVKSDLNLLVEEANIFDLALHFENLDELLHAHHPLNCTHHMQSCIRSEDAIFEVAMYLKAAESSTKDHLNHVYVDIIV